MPDISSNMTWIFSGVGITIILIIAAYIRKHFLHGKFEPVVSVEGYDTKLIELPKYQKQDITALVNAAVSREDRRLPSYNCGVFVEDTIHSVQRQTYKNWELLFVDDCSTDDTEIIIKGFRDSRIHYFKNEKNRGAAISRNRALREAKGRWIAFLDSDDLWEPTKLERQVQFMEDNGYAFSYTRYEEINTESKPLGVEVSGPKHISKYGMYAYCWPGCLTVMYDTTKVGLIQIDDIKKNNDYAMWLKVCQKVDCFLLDDCLAKYRRGRSGSISSHGYITLVKWHYMLFYKVVDMNPILSAFMTCLNLICGFFKKIRYVRKIKPQIFIIT